MTTRTRRLRVAGLTLGVIATAVAAACWSSAQAASIKKSPRPAITHLSLSGSGASRSLNLTLSRGATINVTIARATGGHMVKKHCQIKAVKGKPCTVMVLMASRKYRGTHGRNSLNLPVGNLQPGRYVGTVWAQSAGLSSARHTFRLTVEAVVVKPPATPTPTPPQGTVPAPHNPSGPPTFPPNFTNPTPTPSPAPGPNPPPPPVTPASARTWGQAGKATALVVYDKTGQYGWIGELNAIAAGNLATHFGKVTAEPIVDYQSGQINQYTATIYVGSTYDEPIPTVFLNDVLGTTHPVVWASDNIWQLAGTEGSSANSFFRTKYGWDPSASFFDPVDNPTTISYNGQTFTRNSLNGTSTMLQPNITNSSSVKVLATANCSTAVPPANCASQASGQSVSPTFPWAIRSGNLTYIGEDPLAYISETDRYLIFSDLLFDALEPSATTSHLAMVRLEDTSPAATPTDIANLKSAADYFASKGVPFSINVIPEYTDPFGINNADHPLCPAAGTACTVKLTDAGAAPYVAALKYAVAKGGTLIDEGYTHQFSNLFNPYSGISGDDAEFYRAQCSSTQNTLTVVNVTATSPCPSTDFIVWTGPLPGDSRSAAASRVSSAVSLFNSAGLGTPRVWVTPHYFASVPDYQAINSQYPVRNDREVFPSGLLTGTGPDYSKTISQFFPYVVHDVYGSEIVPENLGDYEPTAQNGNPPRVETDIQNEAKVNLAVRQGFASFFYDLNDNPLTNMETIVVDIQNLGYKFVGPTDPSVGGS